MKSVKKAPGRNGFKYKPQFGLIIVCKDEKEQARLYEKFKGRFSCRVVTV